MCLLSCFSHLWLYATSLTAACQAPLAMGFSRQEYCSGLPCPPPENLPNSGIKPASLISPSLAGRLFTTSATWEAHWLSIYAWFEEKGTLDSVPLSIFMIVPHSFDYYNFVILFEIRMCNFSSFVLLSRIALAFEDILWFIQIFDYLLYFYEKC